MIRGADNVTTDATGAMHEVDPLSDPLRAAKAVLRSYDHRMADFTLSGDAFERFEQIGRTLLEAGIDLRVVYSPVHASLLEIQRRRGVSDDVEQLLRELSARLDALALDHPGRSVELWDFSGYHADAISPIPESDAIRWKYRDPSHFRPSLGDRVIGAMDRGGSDPAHPDRMLGLRLGADEIDTHLQRIGSERTAWLAAHPAEVEKMHALIHEAAVTD